MMSLNNNLFLPGKVLYNSFDIDFERPFAEQLEELNEDLIQVEYNEKYILDIGWYPEHNANGNIIIQLIFDNQWDTPIVKEKVNNIDSLLKIIKEIQIFLLSKTN